MSSEIALLGGLPSYSFSLNKENNLLCAIFPTLLVVQINNVLVKFLRHTDACRSTDLSRRVAVNQTPADREVADGTTRGSMHASVDVCQRRDRLASACGAG